MSTYAAILVLRNCFFYILHHHVSKVHYCLLNVAKRLNLRSSTPYKPPIFYFLFFKQILFIYFRERGGEGEREGENHQCVVACSMPTYWGPGPQPSHMP